MDGGLKSLMARFARPGRVEWIGLRPRYRAPVEAVQTANAVSGFGLTGDHRAIRGGGQRQITLIQAEHLAVVAATLGREAIDPALLRRNIVVAGINLLALQDREFRIGDAVLLGTGPCAPCSRMEQALGRGGLNAMRGHGGITASVVTSGTIRLGDSVQPV
ncbi:MAG TPA: MOSC domain-containing protein [Burkholderiales bacterium]